MTEVMLYILALMPAIVLGGLFLVALYFVLKCAIKKALMEYFGNPK